MTDSEGQATGDGGATAAEGGSYHDRLQREDDYRKSAIEQALAAGEPLPELYFATVRAIGTPLQNTVIRPLGQVLNEAGYDLHVIKLSDCLAEAQDPPLDLTALTPLAHYDRLNQLGVEYCERYGRRDAIVLAAIRKLNEQLRPAAREAARKAGRRGVAYLFRNLMHPKEIERLRKLYGKQLFVISAFSSEEERYRNLKGRLGGGDFDRRGDVGGPATRLISRESGRDPSPVDSRLHGKPSPFRMNIPRTWQYGDLFVDITNEAQASEQIKRLVRLIFSDPFRTPRSGEVGMAQAFGAALESGNLARRVGASILNADGDIVSIGTNDVARPGGGVYRAGEDPDKRDHKDPGHDSSDRSRKTILTNLVEHLLSDPEWLRYAQLPGDPAGLLVDGLKGLSVGDEEKHLHMDQIVSALIESDIIWNSQFFDVIEYGRTLHAEMDAITSAARKQISTRGGTLYCTTLPCHECARLIIGAGIKRVIFVEPYEKSRADDLYATEMKNVTWADSRAGANDGMVHIIPYVGISPRRFDDLFSWVPRKADDALVSEEEAQRLRESQPPGARPPRTRRALDGRTVEYNIRSAEVRESIAGGDAIESVSRFIDLLIHERRTIDEFEADRPVSKKASDQASTTAPG